MPQLPITPPGSQLTLFYGYTDQGFTFNFYALGQDYAAGLTLLNDVNSKLMLGMVTACKVKWGRISFTDVRGDAAIVSPASFEDPAGLLGGTVGMEAAAAVMTRWSDAGGRWWNHYHHAIPSDWMTADGSIDTSATGYAAWLAGLADLIGRIAFPTKKGASPGERNLVLPETVEPIRILSHKVGRPFGVSAGRAA